MLTRGGSACRRKWPTGVGFLVAVSCAADVWGLLDMKAEHEGHRKTASLNALVRDAEAGGQSLCQAPSTSYYWEMRVREWGLGRLGCEGDRVLDPTEDDQLRPVRGRSPVEGTLHPVTGC